MYCIGVNDKDYDSDTISVKIICKLRRKDDDAMRLGRGQMR